MCDAQHPAAGWLLHKLKHNLLVWLRCIRRQRRSKSVYNQDLHLFVSGLRIGYHSNETCWPSGSYGLFGRKARNLGFRISRVPDILIFQNTDVRNSELSEIQPLWPRLHWNGPLRSLLSHWVWPSREDCCPPKVHYTCCCHLRLHLGRCTSILLCLSLCHRTDSDEAYMKPSMYDVPMFPKKKKIPGLHIPIYCANGQIWSVLLIR